MAKLFAGPGVPALRAGALLALVNGILYSWSVYMIPLEQSMGWTRPQTSLVFTFILVFFGMGMMSGGFLMRLLGTRMTAAMGGTLLAAGLACSSLAVSPWQLILSYGVMGGFGIGVANVVPIAVGVSWYPERRGLVCGIMAFCLAFGTLLFGSGLSTLLIRFAGISHTLRVMAVLALVLALSASLFLKMPPTQVSSLKDSDVESLTTFQMVKTRGFRLIWLWELAIQTGGLMVIGHVVPYAMEQGASSTQASLAMGVYAIANGFGRLVFGSLYDMTGFRLAMLANAFCMLTGLLLLAFLTTHMGYAGLLLAVTVIALSFGGTIPQFSAYIAQNFGPAHLQSNLGMTATVFIVTGFSGPFAGGCLYSLTGSYQVAILTAACLAIPGALAVLRAPGKNR